MISPTLIAIDTETSGLSPEQSEILSIAAVSSRIGSEPFVAYVLPTKEVPAEAAKVNGYTPERWAEKEAMPLKHALLDFLRWLDVEKKESRGDLLPLAHHAAFDRPMVQAAEASTGIRLGLTYRWRCSMVFMLGLMDAGLLPHSYVNLDTLGDLSGFWEKTPRSTQHDALQDAQACLHGYLWLLDIAKNQPSA